MGHGEVCVVGEVVFVGDDAVAGVGFEEVGVGVVEVVGEYVGVVHPDGDGLVVGHDFHCCGVGAADTGFVG